MVFQECAARSPVNIVTGLRADFQKWENSVEIDLRAIWSEGVKWLPVASLWAAVPLCILAVPSANLDPKTSSPDWQVFISSSVTSCTCRYSTQTRPESLPSTSFTIHYSPVLLPFSSVGCHSLVSWLNDTRTKTCELKWTENRFRPKSHDISILVSQRYVLWLSCQLCFGLPVHLFRRGFQTKIFPPCTLHFRPVVSFFI